MTAQRKILIVDDDNFLLDMYSIKFKKGGFDVDTAHGGADAIRKISEGFKPDVILMDVVMPGMDGIELLETIKKDHLADSAVYIMLTNQGQPADIEKAKTVGVHGYIVKASSIPSEVLDTVTKICEQNSKKK